MSHESNYRLSLQTTSLRRPQPRAWSDSLRQLWAVYAPSRATIDRNVSFFTSGAVHCALVIMLALIVPSESVTRGIELVVVGDHEPERDLEVVETVSFEAPQLEPLEKLPPIAAEHVAQAPAFDAVEPTELADLTLVDGPVPGVNLLDVATLSQDLEQLKPKRALAPSKGAKGLAEKQLAELAVPENAKQAGAFTVFASPADPEPNKPYWLIVQLTLPPEKSGAKIGAADLSGQLAGSDGFGMFLPGGPRLLLRVQGTSLSIAKPAELHDRFHFHDGCARWAIWVPAAGGGVRDIIRVQSRLLKQQRDIELAF